MEIRPIDANALKVRMFRSREFNRDTCSFDLPVVPWHDIEDAETLDYEPVRHGQWGEYEAPFGFPSLNGFPCSVCGMHQTDIRGLYYCPNCGAKMDGGQ